MARTLYGTATNCSNLLSVSVSNNHDNPTGTAMIETVSTSLTLGDSVTVDLGYSDEHQNIFTGYVKQIERKIPNDTYIITAYDNMVRAQDYFIASSNPDSPLSFQNITAEDLVAALMAEAGLLDFTYDATSFTFGIRNRFEVNLVSSYDYSRTIADLLTWTLWADSSGGIHFENRKPYVMTGDTGQPGDVADVPTGFEVTKSIIIDLNYIKSERYLRNRVVVYGAEGVYAEASESSSALPTGFYKSAVLAFPQLVDDGSTAQSIADYNLDLLHRITEAINVTILGKPSVAARTVIEMDWAAAGLTGSWYVFGCDHSWGSGGYTTNLELRRMTRVT